jgi:ribonucleotide reductase alpha subunit
MDKGVLSRVHYLAWKNKLKTLYYLRTEAEHRVENVSSKVERDALKDYVDKPAEGDECLNCQG